MNFLLYATGFGHTQIQSEISGGSLGKKLQKRKSQTYCSMNFLIYATTFGHTQIHTATGIWELSAPATHT